MDVIPAADRATELGNLAALVLDTLEDGFYVADEQWRFVYANRRACEMWGVARGSIVGRTLWECFPELLGTEAAKRLREVRSSAGEGTFEVFSPVVLVWLRVRVCRLGRGLFGVYLRDIDEQKRADRELRGNEERLGIASQAVQIGFWERDLSTNELRSSDQCKANYGLPRDAKLDYDTVFAAIHPAYRDRVREASRRAVREGTAYESEYPIAWPDGSTHWISVRGKCIYDQDGTPLRTVGVTIDITHRKHAEEALRENEERFRRVFEESPLGRLIADLDFRLREVNSTLCKMLGYQRSELVGCSVLEFFAPERRDDCRRHTAGLACGSIDRLDLEERLLRKSGDSVWARVNVVPMRRADGTVLHMLAVIEDISGRKRLEEELKESEQRYRLFAEAATEGVLVHDFETVLDVSARFAEIFGYRPEELIGTNLRGWPMLVPPTRLEAAVELGKAGQVLRHELACFRRDGSPLALEYSAKDVAYQGRPVRIVIARDITERKRVEERMRELNERLEQQVEQRARQLYVTEARLSAFFENSPDRITLQRLTPDGRWVYEDINPTCERAYGIGRAEIIGRTLEDVLGPEAAQVPLHYFRECLRTGAPKHYIVRRTMAGQTRLLDVMAVLVPGESERGERFIITIARDITEREKLEAQLRQAQKMEAVGQLTGGVAHDFNNLLTAVVASLELIQSKSADGRIRKLADIALRAATRGGQLTQQLLSFSRRQNLRPAIVDLGKLLRETEALLRRAVGEAVAMSIAAEPNLWPCEVDAAQFEAAVMNLVVNARDAMPDGGRLVLAIGNTMLRVGEGGLDLPLGDYVVLTVSDTGHGMTPEVLAHAFEPFFTTKEIGKGSGLGLSMVHGFARQSGGTVRIDSEPGRGTTVRLYLPRAFAEPAERSATEQERVRLPRSSATVLVVEDDQDVLQATVDVLRSLDYRVFVASSGQEALEVIRAGEPLDLLLTDVVMPGGMSGIELAERARQLRPSIEVLLTSGYSADAFLGSGQDFPFLAKPYRPSELVARIGELLSPPAPPA